MTAQDSMQFVAASFLTGAALFLAWCSTANLNAVRVCRKIGDRWGARDSGTWAVISLVGAIVAGWNAGFIGGAW